jgi:hypothetical protein
VERRVARARVEAARVIRVMLAPLFGNYFKRRMLAF